MGKLLLASSRKKSLHLDMKLLSLVAFSFVGSLALLQANPADSKGGAKITMNEAEHIALRDHARARVTSAKLESVHGKMVWSVDVAGPKAGHLVHVSVDAMSGQILSQQKSEPPVKEANGEPGR
ncbi:MAG: PepSY domain-containing protein [Chthoniobacterales bacterium]